MVFLWVPSLCIVPFRPRPPSYKMRSQQVLKSKQVETLRLLHPLRNANVLSSAVCQTGMKTRALSSDWKGFQTLQPLFPGQACEVSKALLSKPYEMCWEPGADVSCMAPWRNSRFQLAHNTCHLMGTHWKQALTILIYLFIYMLNMSILCEKEGCWCRCNSSW